MARKFNVGDEVRIKSFVGKGEEEFEGAVGTITENHYEGDRIIGHVVATDSWGVVWCGPSHIERLPMTSRPSYIAGVAKANEARIARERLAADRLQAFEAWGVSALAESLNSAKAHRDANRAKYASQAKMTVKFTPVAKGSEPIRVNVWHLDRRSYRKYALIARSENMTVEAVIDRWNELFTQLTIAKRGEAQ
jgi:hypothetical protein